MFGMNSGMVILWKLFHCAPCVWYKIIKIAERGKMGEMNWIEVGNQTLLQRRTFNNLNSVQPLARAAKIYEVTYNGYH